MNTLSFLNRLIAIIFTVCYAYQILYSPIVWLFCKKRASSDPVPLHRFAALICARNEAAVIGDLIDSLKAQIYPQEFLSMFVMADNCTDETADIAILHGAKVYTRYNTNLIGKGYALEELKKADLQGLSGRLRWFFVFDADNLLERDYIEQMNFTF